MGLLSSSSSSKTYLTETNVDQSMPSAAGQNVVGGGGSVGASDFGKSVNLSATGKNSIAESWDVQDGIVINRSNGTYNFEIYNENKDKDAITEEVLSKYIDNASQEQLSQTQAVVSTTAFKVAAGIVGVLVLWQMVKK